MYFFFPLFFIVCFPKHSLAGAPGEDRTHYSVVIDLAGQAR